LTGVTLAATTRPHWPSWRDLATLVLATGVMAFIVLQLRAWPPGVLTLIEQAGIGVASYAALAYLLDVAKARARFSVFIEARRAVGSPLSRSERGRR